MRAFALTLLLLATLPVVSLVGCGGGGGGDDTGTFSGAASVSIRVQPSQIDSGDRALVELSIGDVHENGIALKIRYPRGLAYVPGTASITINDEETTIRPTVNKVSNEDEAIYLVFYLSQKLFRTADVTYNGEPADIHFQLAGKSTVKDGLVEVDPDVDDPRLDNATEFDLSNPEFLAEDQAPISVVVGQ